MTQQKHSKRHRLTRWALRHLWHRLVVTVYHRLMPLPGRCLIWLGEHVLRHEVRKHKKEGRK